VQRALDKKADFAKTENVLKYVAIHVGTPKSARALVGHGMFDSREVDDPTPGGHYLIRVGGGGGGCASRPQTHSGNDRRPNREEVPLHRVSPRKLVPLRCATAPVAPGSPLRRSRNVSLREALGGKAGAHTVSTQSLAQTASSLSAVESCVSLSSFAEAVQ